MSTPSVLKSLLLSVFLCTTHFISAQTSQPWSVGAYTGVSLANASIKNGIPGDYNTLIVFNVDLCLEYSFQNQLSIQTQVGFLQTGYQISDRTPLSVNVDQQLMEFENSYTGYDFQYLYHNLVNSWLIAYTFGKKYTIKPQIGLFGGLNLGTKTESVNYIYIDPEDHELIGDPTLPLGYLESLEDGKIYRGSFTPVQFGIVSGLVLAYRIDDQYQISLRSNFYLDLIDSASSELTGFEQYFRTFTINLGFTVNLGGKNTGS
jgi:hypothetical protein